MALAGVVMSVTGNFDRHLIGTKVRNAGGRVDNLVHKNVQYVVCDQRALDMNTQRIRKAIRFGIPLVSEGFVIQSLKAGKVVDHRPFLFNTDAALAAMTPLDSDKDGKSTAAAEKDDSSFAKVRAQGNGSNRKGKELEKSKKNLEGTHGKEAHDQPASTSKHDGPRNRRSQEKTDNKLTEKSTDTPTPEDVAQTGARRSNMAKKVRIRTRKASTTWSALLRQVGCARLLGWLGRTRAARLHFLRQMTRRKMR